MESKDPRKLAYYGELYEVEHETYRYTSDDVDVVEKLCEEAVTPIHTKSIHPTFVNVPNNVMRENNITFATKVLYNRDRKYVIRLDSWPKFFFNFILNLLLIYSVVSSLYYLGYSHPSQTELDFDLFVWVMFIIDFILNFFTEILDDKNLRIRNIKIISMNYAYSWMFFDVLSLLPLQYAGHADSEYFLRLFRIFKMDRLYRMIRMDKVNKYFGNLFFKENLLNLKKFTIIVNGSWDFFYQILVMLFFSYALSCIWSYWVNLIKQDENELNNFVMNFNLETDTDPTRMVITWYYIYTTLMTVGYGDYYATNKYEMGLCIILLILGPAWYAYAMGQSISTIRQLEDLTNYSDKISDVDTWLSTIDSHYKEIPQSLKESIRKHFLNYFKKDRAGSLAEKYWLYESNEEKLVIHNKFLNEISEECRQEIMEYLYGEIFIKFRSFFRKEKFKFQICLHIQPRIYPGDHILLTEGLIPREILFVEEGIVICGFTYNKDFYQFYKFKGDSIIGDYFAIAKIPSYAEFRSKGGISGFAIPSKITRLLLKSDPKFQLKVRKYSAKNAMLIENTLKSEKEKLGIIGEDKHASSSFNRNDLVTKMTRKSKPMLGTRKLSERKSNFVYLGEIEKVMSKAHMHQKNLLEELKEKFNSLGQDPQNG